jgi:hypothetical protein
MPDRNPTKTNYSNSRCLNRRRFKFGLGSRVPKPMRIHADPDPVQTLPSQKVGFLQKNIFYVPEGTGNILFKVL